MICFLFLIYESYLLGHNFLGHHVVHLRLSVVVWFGVDGWVVGLAVAGFANAVARAGRAALLRPKTRRSRRRCAHVRH